MNSTPGDKSQNTKENSKMSEINNEINQTSESCENINSTAMQSDAFTTNSQSTFITIDSSEEVSEKLPVSLVKGEVLITESTIPIQNITKPSTVFEHFKLITGAWDEFRPTEKHHEVFLKGCKWSPDGTCLLTCSEDATMRLFDLPLELYNRQHLPNCEFPGLRPSLRCKIGGRIYDYTWYPLMSSTSPDTCCFLTTSFHTPVQLWDAYDGTLRCSYRGYNLQDELDAALSIAFDPCGDFVLCGYKNSVKIFHTDIPGRDFINISTKNICEQKGIVSCLTVNPAIPSIFAAGTYSSTIGLYSMEGNAMCLLVGQTGGLTQIMFSQDGSRLYAAARKDPEIICWDLRQLGQILYVLQRPHTTNQRIYFDISADDCFLFSGSSDGDVRVWDLKVAPTLSTDAENRVIESLTQWHSHDDCVNGVSVHKFIPLVATASGQRNFPKLLEHDEEVFSIKQEQCEDCVKLWWYGST